MPRPVGARDRRARLVTVNRVGLKRNVADGGSPHVRVIGGGLAGTAAALVLAERGVRVTMYEAAPVLGGRLASWADQLGPAAADAPDGAAMQMERGFHAFFRQYYNLRTLLRRVDPTLRFLRAVDDYPLFGPHGAQESFTGLPRTPPFNLMALVRRTPTIGWRDLRAINGEAAAEMLAFDGEETYARFDSLSAAEYLDSVRFPGDARRMLFEVFAHSFFNPQETMSAAEMLMMFHLYFCGSAEGILFDVLDEPFGDALWRPMHRLLASLGVDIRLGTSTELGDLDARGDTDGIVVATNLTALQHLVRSSTWAGQGSDEAQKWASSIETLRPAPPFAVWRIWFDGDVDASRQPFAGTAGMGIIDNISCVHRYQGEAHRWALRTGGSVLELHAYALPKTHASFDSLDSHAHDSHDAARIQTELLAQLHATYPETRAMTIVEDRFLLRQDCPGFSVGSHAHFPGVVSPHPGLVLAGDLVRVPFPTALMERAATSGFLAANELLRGWGVAPEPVWTVPTRGVLANLQSWQRKRKNDRS